MSRCTGLVGRALGGMAMAVMAVASPIGSAHAEEVTVDRTGYGYAQAASTPPAPLPVEPPLEQEGQLPVVIAGGEEQARSFLHIDVLDAAAVEKLTLTIGEHGAPVPPSAAPEAAQVDACLLVFPFEDGAAPSGTALPTVDCSAAGRGARDDESGIWTFDLSALATRWAEGDENFGVGLVPVMTSSSDAWRVVFDAATATADVELLPPVDEGETTEEVPSEEVFDEPVLEDLVVEFDDFTEIFGGASIDDSFEVDGDVYEEPSDVPVDAEAVANIDLPFEEPEKSWSTAQSIAFTLLLGVAIAAAVVALAMPAGTTFRRRVLELLHLERFAAG